MESNYKIILASNSPRRRELLAGLGLDFEVRVLQGVDERYPETLPVDETDACRMLRQLSGKTHHVVTGVCLTTTTAQRRFSVTTEVTFKKLTDNEIHYYVDNYHPLDKAGAYGIQEWIGYICCTGLRGSYYNVMGLPVQRIYTELAILVKSEESSFAREK